MPIHTASRLTAGETPVKIDPDFDLIRRIEIDNESSTDEVEILVSPSPGAWFPIPPDSQYTFREIEAQSVQYRRAASSTADASIRLVLYTY